MNNKPHSYNYFNTAFTRSVNNIQQSKVDQAKTLLAEVAKLSDEDLKRRGFKMGEPSFISHLNLAVWANRATLSLEEAVSLLRLVPLLAKTARDTTHRVTIFATHMLKDALKEEKSPDLQEAYTSLIRSAGAVCFKGRMREGLEANLSKQEYELLTHFVEKTSEFKDNQDRVAGRQKKNHVALKDFMAEAPNAICIASHQSIMRLPKDEFAYVRKD